MQMKQRIMLILLLSSTFSNIPQISAKNLQKTHSWKDKVIDRQESYDYSTTTPLIGILTQPDHTKKHQDMQGISGPLVSWIESAGGRVVPIRYGASEDEMVDVFNSINGIVFPVRQVLCYFYWPTTVDRRRKKPRQTLRRSQLTCGITGTKYTIYLRTNRVVLLTCGMDIPSLILLPRCLSWRRRPTTMETSFLYVFAACFLFHFYYRRPRFAFKTLSNRTSYIFAPTNGFSQIHGVCLGFETLHILTANRTREELLVKAAGQEGMANTIEFTRDADDSYYFREWSVRTTLLVCFTLYVCIKYYNCLLKRCMFQISWLHYSQKPNIPNIYAAQVVERNVHRQLDTDI